jgi:hypothetical protein
VTSKREDVSEKSRTLQSYQTFAWKYFHSSIPSDCTAGAKEMGVDDEGASREDPIIQRPII